MWGRALAPRVSSITNTQLQRRRATTSGIFPKQLRPGINTNLTTTDLCQLALHGNEVLAVTKESVNLDLEMGQNICQTPDQNKKKSDQTKNLERLYIWVVVCSLFVWLVVATLV